MHLPGIRVGCGYIHVFLIFLFLFLVDKYSLLTNSTHHRSIFCTAFDLCQASFTLDLHEARTTGVLAFGQAGGMDVCGEGGY